MHCYGEQPVSSEAQTVRAAGALLWRPSARHGVRVALVHRPRYGDWSLPKGKAEAGETAPMTAAREVLEETGFTSVLGRRLTTVRYAVSAGPKRVDYFAARMIDGSFVPNKEVDRLEWCTIEQARQRSSYEFDLAVLDTFIVHPPTVSSLLLVRHARAGVRESWAGNDATRPLDDKGNRQAQALRQQLAPFGPEGLISAPIERCLGTLAPLAKDLRLRIRREAVFTEDEYRHDPAAARRRITELAKAGETVAVCSQGGVIPGVVKSLASRAELKVGPVNTPKSAFWLLTFDDGTLVQADSYPAPDV